MILSCADELSAVCGDLLVPSAFPWCHSERAEVSGAPAFVHRAVVVCLEQAVSPPSLVCLHGTAHTIREFPALMRVCWLLDQIL